MVIIYSTNQSARLAYTLDEIFVHRLNLPYTITSNREDYILSDFKVKINYSTEQLEGIQIFPSGFLFETGINANFKPQWTEFEQLTVLFPVASGFDIFSMCFWCLSRYEEYQPFPKDHFGRFSSTVSIFFQKNLIGIPLLDLALLSFYNKMGVEVPDKYSVIPTFDIDMAFKHKGKTPLRWVLGLCKSLITVKIPEFLERISVAMGKTDPFDSFNYISATLMSYQSSCKIFIHAGTRGKMDKIVPLENTDYYKILQKLNNHFEIGIHPSWQSENDAHKVSAEMERLTKVIKKPITSSRQHYLKITFPQTYYALISNGIQHDYSMGFADSPGYRAGTAISFRFYDLVNEKSTNLQVHPFCFMDVALKNYQKKTHEEALKIVLNLKSVCRENNLPFVFIFHNESVSENGDWRNWRRVYEECLS